MSANYSTQAVVSRLLTLEFRIKYGYTDSDYPFDPFLSLPADKADRVATWIDEIVGSRKRQLKVQDRESYGVCLRAIIANALEARRQGKPCAYHRGVAGYDRRKRVLPSGISQTNITRMVDGMVGKGYLIGTLAPQHPKCGELSTYQASDRLLEALGEAGLEPENILLVSVERPLVILKDENKKLISVDEENQNVIRMKNALSKYNDFMEHQKVEIPDKVGLLFMARHISLYRVFNNSSFDHGGRFFGGAWQRIGRNRHLIRINGNETIELDFSGFMPRALYHLSGMEYDGDPYDIEELRKAIVGAGISWKITRDVLKVFFMKLLNSSSRRGLLWVYKGNGSEPIAMQLPIQYTPATVMKMLEEKHSLISDSFLKKRSLELMNKESLITSLVLSACVDAGISVLPVHDSYIVEKKHRDFLQTVMEESYIKVFGYMPVIR